MRNKKIFSFNEEKDAEKIIVNGFESGTIDYSQMYVIAKYFHEKFGYGEIRLEREIIKFCKVQDKNFNPIIESESIKKWVKTAMLYNLRKVDPVSITKKEIEFLTAVESPKDRKLLFVTLVLSKALKNKNTKSDKFYIHYNNLLDIVRLSKMANMGEINLADVLHDYKDNFTFYNAEKELIRVDYANPESEEIFRIDDLDNMTDYFELFFGKNKTFCVVCGKEFTKKSNRQKACPDCTKILARKRTEKWRNKNL